MEQGQLESVRAVPAHLGERARFSPLFCWRSENLALQYKLLDKVKLIPYPTLSTLNGGDVCRNAAMRRMPWRSLAFRILVLSVWTVALGRMMPRGARSVGTIGKRSN